jgi:hypothetical protein
VARTLVLSALAFLPTVVICIVRHHPTSLLPGFTAGYQKQYMTLNTVLWSILGTTLATIISRVTYGLRRQVAEANELGQYVLEEKIGAGGMGEVWRARHRLLIRPAAIKLIHPQMSGDPELLLRRFEREARATAALKSPHTVQLYDFGATEDGRLYYVMELLDGLDLDTLVKQYGPLPAERVVHILRQVCSSLQDAHVNGLVHRDIKPANVVISRAGTTFDFAKVLDFGLVRLDAARKAEDDAVKLSTEGAGHSAEGRTADTPGSPTHCAGTCYAAALDGGSRTPRPSVCYPLAHRWPLCASPVRACCWPRADLLSGVWGGANGGANGGQWGRATGYVRPVTAGRAAGEKARNLPWVFRLWTGGEARPFHHSGHRSIHE